MFETVTDAVGEVVHRVNHVLAASTWMRLILQPVHDGVAKGRIGVVGNALQPQSLVVCQIGKNLQRLLNASLSVRVGLLVPPLHLYLLL